MKKTLLVFALLLSIISVKAQEDTEKTINYEKQNEVKLNSVMLLAGAFEAIYERNLNEESSVGISVFVPFDQESFDESYNYYISPYYRIFFGKKYAAGFFVEGFGMLNSFENNYYDYGNSLEGSYNLVEEDETNFALGIGLGGKWVSRGGFVFELSSGFGRNLFEVNDQDNQFVGKFGFNLGYRF